jgi:hypothetical protein
VMTVGRKGSCFIDHVNWCCRNPRMSPADSIPLDSDSVALLRLKS